MDALQQAVKEFPHNKAVNVDLWVICICILCWYFVFFLICISYSCFVFNYHIIYTQRRFVGNLYLYFLLVFCICVYFLLMFCI